MINQRHPSIPIEVTPNTSWYNYTNLTTHAQDVLNVPHSAIVIALVYLCTNLAVGAMSNSLLILIIHKSPTLRTPANSHLVNICANNLILCCTMLLSIVSILLPVDPIDGLTIMTGLHVFLIANCLTQYWGTFAAIGYFRSQIIQRPSLPMKRRRQIITRCLTSSWVTSLLISSLVCISHIENDNYACITFNPFQKSLILCNGLISSLNPERMGVKIVHLFVFLGIFVILFTSYCRVLKMLRTGKTFNRNKVIPVPRSSSIASVMSDTTSFRNITAATGTCAQDICTSGPYMVSTVSEREIHGANIMVHYRKHEGKAALTFEDIIALENPILAASLRKRAFKRSLHQQQSNASNVSIKSNKNQDFSDISAEADIRRLHYITNRSALRNHFLKRDHIGFNSATKNSLVMMTSLFVCSLPLFVCLFPRVFAHTKESHRVLILMFTTLIFYLNAPIFPLWYLVQNRRVRRCLTSLLENLYSKLRHT